MNKDLDAIGNDAVLVSRKGFDSDKPYDIIQSNIDFLNAEFEEYLMDKEVATDALHSYYVDYYLAQMNNGGFCQFIYNSGWNTSIVQYVHDGLREIGALEHLALFEKSAKTIEDLGAEKIEAFFNSEGPSEASEWSFLEKHDQEFFPLCEKEDLIKLNAKWLRQLPNLVVLSIDEMREVLKLRAQAVPNRDERIEEAKKNEPRYMQLIRALCAATEQELVEVTAGDPAHEYNGEEVTAWYFLTNKGLHYMIDQEEKAILFNDASGEQICEITIV